MGLEVVPMIDFFFFLNSLKMHTINSIFSDQQVSAFT